MAAEDFSKVYDDTGLVVKQIRIRPDRGILKQRKSIVEHPFGTIKRGMEGWNCLTRGLGNAAGEFSLTQGERIKKEYPRRGSGVAGPRFFDQKPGFARRKPGFTRRRPRRRQLPVVPPVPPPPAVREPVAAVP
jgi:hypothetical protein